MMIFQNSVKIDGFQIFTKVDDFDFVSSEIFKIISVSRGHKLFLAQGPEQNIYSAQGP